jgi:hypothetical protein
MIAKVIPRKHGAGSFRDSINYNLGLSKNDTERVEYIGTRNLFAPEAAALEMESLASENTRSSNPLLNCILSWRENEIPSEKQADEAVDIVLDELGLKGCQVHFALHRNTQNLHLHLCVNRIDPETFKARDPAHGWTKKALERASRKIELNQGWEIERTGRYAVTANGEILEKSREADKIKISQVARDIETHTATKSAERIAQEIAAPIIRDSWSWEEVHVRLAKEGMSYERKGSGATLRIGDTVVKASRTGSDLSFSKLAKRLGEYRDRDVSVIPRDLKLEPVERATAPKVKSSWERYQEEKAEYSSSKKATFSELQKRHKQEREKVFKKHKEERSVIFARSWKGKGAELNQLRSVTAAKQQAEKIELLEQHKREREEKKKRFPQEFPSFKNWLNQGKNPEPLAQYRYPEYLILFGAGNEERPGYEEKFDLRDYTPIVGSRRDGVMYCRKNKKEKADFIDYGKKIVFTGKIDDAALLAALQLAQQKWGGVNISGDERYKKKCLDIALREGIHIFIDGNETVAKIVAKEERSQKNQEKTGPDSAQTQGAATQDSVSLEIGRRVAFHKTGIKTPPVGIIIKIDDKTVTMRCGQINLTFPRAGGYFTEPPAQPATRQQERQKHRTQHEQDYDYER